MEAPSLDVPESMRDRTRDKIVVAAAQLLVEGGREAVSTRAICAAAAVQPPTIYRLFGDKQGLLDAVAMRGFSEHLDSHTGLEPTGDPLADLRSGWDLHVQFGLAHPYLYSLMYGQPQAGSAAPSAVLANRVLAAHVQRIAAAGLLRVSEERAAHLLHAAGCGTTLTLIAMPEKTRDLGLSEMSREAVIAAITAETDRASDNLTEGVPSTVSRAVALRTVLGPLPGLTLAESDVLREWLDKIVAASSDSPTSRGSE